MIALHEQYHPWANPKNTRAVRGMLKTYHRRPRCRNVGWMLTYPTDDALWYAKDRRENALADARRRSSMGMVA